MTAHLRLNGIYWGLTALCIMGHQDALPREEMVEFVMSCWDEEAGASLLLFCVLFFRWCFDVLHCIVMDRDDTDTDLLCGYG